MDVNVTRTKICIIRDKRTLKLLTVTLYRQTVTRVVIFLFCYFFLDPQSSNPSAP